MHSSTRPPILAEQGPDILCGVKARMVGVGELWTHRMAFVLVLDEVKVDGIYFTLLHIKMPTIRTSIGCSPLAGSP